MLLGKTYLVSRRRMVDQYQSKWLVFAQIRVPLASQKEGSFSLSAKALILFGARTACKAFKSGVS